jgi:hypothetical protein
MNSGDFKTAPNAGFYRIKVGDFEVAPLYDGGGPGAFTPDMFHGSEKEIVSLLKEAHVDPNKIIESDTSFLINTGEKLILVDAGTKLILVDAGTGPRIGPHRIAADIIALNDMDSFGELGHSPRTE